MKFSSSVLKINKKNSRSKFGFPQAEETIIEE